MKIVTTIDQLKQYVPTIVSADLAKYEAFINDAETWLSKEITGRTLFDEITVIVVDSEETDNEAILGLCSAVVCLKAYADGIPFFDLIENESGFAVVNNQNLAPASQARVASLQAATYKKLDEAIETLLEYLEETTEYHTAWKGSPAYTLLSDVYLTTVKEFRRYVNFGGGRRDFVALKPEMLNAINLQIAPVISQELSDQIIEQLRDGDITPANVAILKNLRFAMANFTVKQPETAMSYLLKVRRVLYLSPALYPEFEDSEIYKSWLAAQTVTSANHHCSPLFFAGL